MKKESIFDNKTFLVVLSVVMAFLAWIFVSLNSNDTKGKTISGIAIDMQQVDESIGKLGLSTISAEQPKVTVRVEGVIYDIGNLTASDVRVYPDISKVTTAGVHTVELKGEVEDGDKNISIESISPASIQIKFDSLETVTMDIKARLSGYSAPAKDYLIRDVSVSPSSVELTGPAEDIARISQCVVEKDIDQELTSSYSETLPIQFLDVDGNELDLKYVVSDVTEARVTIPILKKKVVPVRLDFINVPEGFPVGQLSFHISNEEIEVAGPAEAIDRYKEIPLGQVDLRTLDIGMTESFAVELPTGFVNTQNIQSVVEHAGTGSADGNGLALQIRNRLDIGVAGDNLHLLHVERGDSGEAVDLAGLLKEVRSVVGVGHNVGLAECELGVAVLKLHDVCLRAVADEANDVHTRVIGRVLGEGIVGAGFAAGDKAELRAGRRSRRRGRTGISRRCGFGLFSAGGERQQHDSCEQKSDKLFHFESSYVCAERTDFFSQVLLYRMRRRFARGVP